MMSFRSMNRRVFMKGAASAGALTAFGCAASSASKGRGPADLILVGGKLWTQDPSHPEAEGIAIRGEHILSIGDADAVLNYRGAHTQVIDLGGRRVVPGLNDSHMHPTRGGRFYTAELRWDGVTSLERGLDMIAQQAKVTPPASGSRVIGGWSPF
ncbi:MAG: amidohydrolase family protein, partial [Myxococcales bacterium]|nr:amidohydrolase family protein [Myxococcales bacterium]